MKLFVIYKNHTTKFCVNSGTEYRYLMSACYDSTYTIENDFKPKRSVSSIAKSRTVNTVHYPQ